ncbi:hypothetical protein B2J93_6172 [Marssonina coronariae]|uniref:Uncharacterized protein n=1 Tax=Diplocarpon coronariae TaxID=2795749 RepID=A0A218ZIG2_9HELO|nr:hypothetical protein B2J93_6172 [Marssonina coronariae]
MEIGGRENSPGLLVRRSEGGGRRTGRRVGSGGRRRSRSDRDPSPTRVRSGPGRRRGGEIPPPDPDPTSIPTATGFPARPNRPGPERCPRDARVYTEEARGGWPSAANPADARRPADPRPVAIDRGTRRQVGRGPSERSARRSLA